MAKLDITQLEQGTTIPDGSLYLVEMGDGSGTKAVTQETLAEETGKALKVGNLAELQTEEKGSLVAAINEAAQSGGGGAAVDILDSKEEIEANTETGKAAGALAVKEMFGALNDNLGGCSLEQVGNDFYIVGADSVRKKLQGEINFAGTTFKGGNSITCKVGDILFACAQGKDANTPMTVSGGSIVKSINGYGDLWLCCAIIKATATKVTVTAYNSNRCIIGLLG